MLLEGFCPLFGYWLGGFALVAKGYYYGKAAALDLMCLGVQYLLLNGKARVADMGYARLHGDDFLVVDGMQEIDFGMPYYYANGLEDIAIAYYVVEIGGLTQVVKLEVHCVIDMPLRINIIVSDLQRQSVFIDHGCIGIVEWSLLLRAATWGWK